MTQKEKDATTETESQITPVSPVDSPSENLVVSDYTRRMPNIISRGLVYLIVTLLLTAVVYSLAAKIDVVVEAKAVARPISHKIKIISDRSGFLERVFIKEGQMIDKNVPLFLIRSKEGLTYKTKVDQFKRSIPLKEEHFSILISASLDKLNQLDSNFVNSIKVKKLRLHQNDLKLDSIDSDLEYWKQESNFRALDRARTQKLLEEGIISTREHDRVSINLEKANSEVKKLISQREITLEENKIIEEEILQETVNYNNEKIVLEKTIRNLEVEKETTLNAMHNELEMNEKMLVMQSASSPNQGTEIEEEKIILAENSGTISELYFKNTGQYIRESDLLCTIIPAKTPLYIDITVVNRDIGFIEKDLEIKYKFDAFPYSDYGILSGKVSAIAPSAIEDKELGLVYHVRGSLESPFFEIKNKKYFIKVGMTATAELVTERKSIFSLLFRKLKGNK